MKKNRGKEGIEQHPSIGMLPEDILKEIIRKSSAKIAKHGAFDKAPCVHAIYIIAN